MPDSISPLYIFSPRHRAGLEALSGQAGWKPVFSTDLSRVADDFGRSGAWVAVIDARDALAEGEAAVSALGPAAEAGRSALLLILTHSDADRLAWFRRQGVTHFLLDPLGPHHFIEGVHYAAQHAERVSGGRRRELRGQRKPATLLFDGGDGQQGAELPSGPTDRPRCELGERLIVDLAEALARDEIEILYQPQVMIASGQIVGAEALARWQHPDLGEIGAEPLLAAAEATGLLVPLSTHIQDKALAEVAAWPDALADIRVAVNVTASDIVSPDFAARFIGRVDEKGVRRSCVTVEITESGLIEDLDQAAEQISRFRDAGIKVAIDDFGTGYSSLAYLKALPVDYIKLDKALVADIGGSHRDRVVIRGVIDMARALGLEVVAEGVETAEQLALLAAEGCALSQGFLHAPPVSGTAFRALLLDQSAEDLR